MRQVVSSYSSLESPIERTSAEDTMEEIPNNYTSGIYNLIASLAHHLHLHCDSILQVVRMNPNDRGKLKRSGAPRAQTETGAHPDQSSSSASPVSSFNITGRCQKPPTRPKMRFFALLPLLAAASATLGVAPTDTDGTVNEESYPLCPANYDTYCCFTVVPYSNHCRRGRCKQEYGWSCLSGPGKVDSIRTCLTREDQEAPKMSAYCKRPGYQ